MTTTTTDLPLLLATVEVTAVERLSPSFVRIELGAPALAELARDGDSYDQRLKLVFPDGDGPVPSFESSDESWYVDWSSRPVAERGHMRTYTLRAVRGEGVDTRLVVDFALHGASAGPGGSWGARARIGDRLALVAPRRGHAFGGIEFEPGSATDVLLVGDETAVPAIAAILEQLDHAVSVTAFLEVPLTADILDLPRRPGVSVDWLPRNGAPRGAALHAAVLDHLGVRAEVPELSDDEVDPALWETPRRTSADSGSPTYAWIAGESKVVTGLRRVLVKDLGFDRSSVAFMGYWRDGVAMKS